MTVAGISGEYLTGFLSGACEYCFATRIPPFRGSCTSEYEAYVTLNGVAVLNVGNLVLLVRLHWSATHSTGGSYCYVDGTVVRALPDWGGAVCYTLSGKVDIQEYLISGAAFAVKLNDLIRLAATVLANKLAGTK